MGYPTNKLWMRTALALIACALPGPLGQEPVEKPAPKKPVYAVVVHEKNPCKQRGKQLQATVKKLFLKQFSKWPDGTAAKPYARRAGTDEEKAFSKQLLDMTDAELARHWLRMKNGDGTMPPKAVRSDRMLVKFVARNRGALGVVKLDVAKKAKGVRILLEF